MLEIAPGVLVFESRRHRMSSGIVLPLEPAGNAPRNALVVDPGVLPSEIERIAGVLSGDRAQAAHLVLTHSDWDHVSGASRFPEARVVASAAYPEEAGARAREVTEEIERSDEEAGESRHVPFVLPAAGSLVGSDSEILGAPRRSRAFPAPGHTADSLALLVAGAGVLFAGDYLSAAEIPFVDFSLCEYRQSLSRFRRLLATGSVETVVPGHGPSLATAEALRVLDLDANYLDALRRAVEGVTSTGGGPQEALAAALKVPVPRAPSDAEVRAGHERNAARAVLELVRPGD